MFYILYFICSARYAKLFPVSIVYVILNNYFPININQMNSDENETKMKPILI